MYDRFDAPVGRMGGTVDRHIGDCVMAVFGVPASHGNDVGRALRGTVEMHAAMRELSEVHGEAMAVHIGVVSGRGLHSDKGPEGLAESGFTVTRSAINPTSRLADKARGLETLITGRILARLGGRRSSQSRTS